MSFQDIRKDFPFFESNPDIIYVDNACMSLRPKVVIDAINKYYMELSACGGRSNHRLAQKVEGEVQKARISIKEFIGAKHDHEIIFVRNTSEAINLVSKSMGLNKGDMVITSNKEHNSNLVPWLKLQNEIGIKHQLFPMTKQGKIDMNQLEEMLSSNVKLVSMVHTSNLDGSTLPIEQIIKMAHGKGVKVLVDAAQSAPHRKINVQELDVDFLAFSGHKMMGPSGMGVLYGKAEALEALNGFMVGGDTVEYTTYEDYKLLPIPEKFEAGLQNYAGIMGLGVAVEYLGALDPDKIHQHEIELNRIVTEGISKIENLEILGPKSPDDRGGVVSFVIKDKNPHQIALMLDEGSKIMVRSGQHCVHSWFKANNLPGSVRASFYAYNTKEEALKIVEQIQLVSEIV
jgi:cysteine desulfurase/selenocysteine lyase